MSTSSQSVIQPLLRRQLSATNWSSNGDVLASVLESHPLECSLMHTFTTTITHMDIDSTDNKFLLVGYNDGSVDIHEIVDQNSGQLNQLIQKKVESTVNRCQWYRMDSGMFAITGTESVSIMDTNTMKRVDNYRFPNCKLYWSDWSPNLTTSIAVASSASTIRIIDIRRGSSLQNITCSSMTGTANHHITRIVWSPLDSECLIAGDSSGYLHIYDIRRLNRSVRVVGSDDMSLEPITCLQFTRDQMSVLTAKGRSNKLNSWHFMRSDLIRSDINFECPLVRSKSSKHNPNTSSYLRCQVFATDDYVFTPSEQKVMRNDIMGYSLTTGMRVHSLCTSREGTFNTAGPNCVTGLDRGSLVLYSGGNQRLCVWTPKMDVHNESKPLNSYYTDRWSDSE